MIPTTTTQPSNPPFQKVGWQNFFFFHHHTHSAPLPTDKSLVRPDIYILYSSRSSPGAAQERASFRQSFACGGASLFCVETFKWWAHQVVCVLCRKLGYSLTNIIRPIIIIIIIVQPTISLVDPLKREIDGSTFLPRFYLKSFFFSFSFFSLPPAPFSNTSCALGISHFLGMSLPGNFFSFLFFSRRRRWRYLGCED